MKTTGSRRVQWQVPWTGPYPVYQRKTPPKRGFPITHEVQEAQASATTLTVRRFFGPLVENSTLPSINANSV